VKRERYHHGNLQPTLVKAALALVEKRGAEGWTLREVARRAGVSHAAPYRHFRNKEALLAAVAEEGWKALGEKIAAAQAKAGKDEIEQLEVYAGVLLAFAMEKPARYRVMLGPSSPPRDAYPSLANVSVGLYQQLLAGVERAQRAGRIRTELSAGLATITLWTALHGFVDLFLNHQLQAFEARSPEAAFSLGRSIAFTIYDGLRPRVA
jgi:AcrR family transcriptional regulator